MEIKTQLSEYLDLLKMKYVWNDEEVLFELEFTERKDEQPATHSPDGDEEKYFRYTIKIKPGEKWVQIYCLKQCFTADFECFRGFCVEIRG